MSTVERIEIAPGYTISRLLKSGWHLSSGHSSEGRHGRIMHRNQNKLEDRPWPG